MAYPVYHIRCYFSTAIHQRISNHQPHSCQNRREHFSWKAYDEPTQTGAETGVGHFPCPQVCERAVCQRGNMRRLCHPRHRRRQSPRPFLPAQLFHHLVPIATFLHPPHLLLDRNQSTVDQPGILKQIFSAAFKRQDIARLTSLPCH